MSIWKIFTAALILFVQAGCSNETDNKVGNKENNDHIWKSQTKALDRAREVESVVIESTKNRQKLIDQQSK